MYYRLSGAAKPKAKRDASNTADFGLGGDLWQCLDPKKLTFNNHWVTMTVARAYQR